MRLTTFCAAALAMALALTTQAKAANSPESNQVEVSNKIKMETTRFETQLGKLSEIVTEARRYAESALGNPDFSPEHFAELTKKAENDALTWANLAHEAGTMIAQAKEDADALLKLREDLFDQYTMEAQNGQVNPGTRIGWSLLRIASAGPETSLRPNDFSYTKNGAEIAFTHLDVPFHIALNDSNDDIFRATAMGYSFVAEWTVLLQKPVGWMAILAKEMQHAGIETTSEWEVMEGPGRPIAFTRNDAGVRLKAFLDGKLLDVLTNPERSDTSIMVREFLAAAETLHNGVMTDESIPRQLRQALHPVLAGTYSPVDPRDYFDSAFCRRLIEADYLESHIPNLSDDRKSELENYRNALAKVEAGYDKMVLSIDDTHRLVAVVGADAAFPTAGETRHTNDQDNGPLEKEPQYEWRLENEDSTVFYSPLPERQLFGFILAERYPGKHTVRPRGVPAMTEVMHPVLGVVASYENGADRAFGSAELWDKAVNMDARGGRSPQPGGLSWGFPMHVLYRDDQGDPVLLATTNGVVSSPDFSTISDESERRNSENAWLDNAASVLGEPGELGLIFHHFFRYCSDSPLPELPNLIGSHYGLSDTHQTVYQSLERRWVGRLIGDCDDLAEFFQVLTRRQGKLSHVMSLPGHAASGHVERLDNGDYRFVVLQTGPVMQFIAPTFDAVVEKAYLAFDRDGGESQLTAAAVPLLLRFADEETRTPFVLSARIYGDAEYAESMIRVQEYWHKYVFSAAIAEMEEMLAHDREPGSIKELGSLYQRVGMYDRSAAMREEELAAAGSDAQASVSALLDLAGMQYQAKNKPAALEALARVQAIMNDLVVREDTETLNRLMPFRSYWAILLAQVNEPERAWDLLRLDVQASKRQTGRVSESVLRTLASVYDRMAQKRDRGEYADAPEELAIMASIEREIDAAIERGFFRRDDAYNAVISRYHLLGRYAVAKLGRKDGLARLREDGPYAGVAKDQTRRGAGIQDEDWEWFRITPRLYLSYAMEMLDRDENPHLYDPKAADEMLRLVDRAIEKGTGLGSDVSGGSDGIRAALTGAFVNQDLDSFNAAMTIVRERDYSSLYDDSAMVFGTYCGLVPVEDFPVWIEAFRQFFPGRQHYFKVAYRALDKGFYQHARMIADATAGYFPDDELLVNEAAFLDGWIPQLEQNANSNTQP